MKLNVKKLYLPLLMVLTIVISGCSATVKQNSKYADLVTVSNNKPVLLFPFSPNGISGDRTKMGLAVAAGVASKYKTSIISAQSLYPEVSYVSWRLGLNMSREVNRGEFKLDNWTSSSKAVLKDMQTALPVLAKGLKATGVIKDKSFEFENVIIMHIRSAGGIPIPFVRRLDVTAAIINLKDSEVVSSVQKRISVARDNKVVLGQLPTEINSLLGDLVQTEEEKKKKAEEAAAE